jgi:hypothetical protein
MKLTLPALLLLGILPTYADAEESPTYEIKSIKPREADRDDKVKVIIEKEAVVFDFHDIRAIGGVSITPKDGKWPKSVVLRLHLGGLEHFQASTGGKITLHASVLSHSGHTKLESIREEGKEKAIAKGDSHWAEIHMMDAKGREIKVLPDKSKGGYFEVTLPAALFEAEMKNLTLNWIDFLR